MTGRQGMGLGSGLGPTGTTRRTKDIFLRSTKLVNWRVGIGATFKATHAGVRWDVGIASPAMVKPDCHVFSPLPRPDRSNTE